MKTIDRIEKFITKCLEKDGMAPTPADIAKHINVSRSNVRQHMTRHKDVFLNADKFYARYY